MTLLPFLPGPYDSLAAPLSLMCQILGMMGLLLVPVGAVWVASGYWSRLAKRQYGIAIAAFVASSLVWAVAVLGALAASGPLLALAATALWIYAVSRIGPRLRPLRSAARRPASAGAFYLLVVPVAVALVQSEVVAPAIAFSRDRAIRNSARLIADIERYRAAQGRYPESPLSLWPDHYRPGVIGIEEYQYEQRGDAYNLVFEQFALHFGTSGISWSSPRSSSPSSRLAATMPFTTQGIRTGSTSGSTEDAQLSSNGRCPQRRKASGLSPDGRSGRPTRSSR